MITRKNGKKGYCRMEKHRDFEFTIHESEASMSSTDKRKNERRYRFVFRVVLAFYRIRHPNQPRVFQKYKTTKTKKVRIKMN